MLYLQTNNISYGYPGADLLFQDITAHIDNHTRCGLIGNNGSGKSTLLRLLSGTLNTTSGTIFRSAGLKIGYLEQENCFLPMSTVEEQLWCARPELNILRQKLNDPSLDDGALLDLCSLYEENGGYQYEIVIEQILEEFNLKSNRNQSTNSLSGGEKNRLALACIIVKKPEILLLDEPTNHLDVKTLQWLEEYLENCRIPFVVISHDRVFLDRCVNQIWALESLSIKVYSGNYTFYREKSQEEYNLKMLKYEVQHKKIRQLRKVVSAGKGKADSMENFKFKRSFKKNGGICKRDDGSGRVLKPEKVMKSAMATQRKIERLLEKEEAKKPDIKQKHKVHFEQGRCRGRTALRLENIGKKFDHFLFRNLDLVLSRRSRLAITGQNGSGKTTLLRIISGLSDLDEGRIIIPESTSIAYFAQEYENLNVNNVILDEVLNGKYTEQSVARTMLGCLGIRKEMVFRKICSLSLGERSKVSLVKTMLSGVNLLLLDEPTNHLEITAREVIEEALLKYEGTIIFVSHDRTFIEKIATETLAI